MTTTITALASIVLKEMYRRKDFYVLFVLTALLTLVMGSARFFNDPHIVRYLQDICLLLIWISSLVIAVTTAARQVPAERENRTIFPLLAKPVSRAQVILGKFLGCWLASGVCLLVFYLFFGAVSASRDHSWPILQYGQALWLHWAMLGVVIALVMLGSLVFSAPSVNATICFAIVGGILILGRHLNVVALQQPEPVRTIVYSLYYIIPHLEWFDIRDLVVYHQPLIAWADCALATAYAGGYCALLLLATCIRFQRKPLNA